MRGIETLIAEGRQPASRPGPNPVTCVCGRTLWLQPKRSPRAGMRFFGAVCACGRGADLYIEKEPRNGARHG